MLPSNWKAYFVQETTEGTTPTTGFTFMGYVDSGSPSPNPNYKQVRASGSPDFYINQRMSIRPMAKVSLIPNKIGFLTSLLSANVSPWYTPFTLYLVDATDTKYLWLKGSYIDRCSIKCDVEEQVNIDLDLVGLTTGTTVLSGSLAADPSGASIPPLFYQNVVVSKDTVALTDWTSVSFEVNKNFIRRISPSTGQTRALASVARDHSLSITRDMDTGSALDEYDDIANDTTRTMKLKLTNPDASAIWSVTVNLAKTTSIDINPLKPEEIIGKQMTYEGSSLTFGTS